MQQNPGEQHTETKTVSVIMSVYINDRPLPLYLSLLSIIKQTLRPRYIFICIDGPIRSNVRRLLEQLSARNDNIVLVENDINCGLAKSMNHLIDQILQNYHDVDFIARMDADDISRLDRFSKQVDFYIDNKEIMVLGTGCQEFGIYNKVINKYQSDESIKKHIIRVTPFIHPSVMFRKELFTPGVRYPENTHLSEDLSFWLLLAKKNISFANLPDVLLEYRLTDQTLQRRVGLSKAFSEFKERFSFIGKQKRKSFHDWVYVFGHFAIRLMPIFLVRLLYRILR